MDPQYDSEVRVSHEGPAPPAEPPVPQRSWRTRRLGALALGIVLAAGLGLWAAQGSTGRHVAAPAGPSGRRSRDVAPGGSYTLLDGTQANLAALRGHPAMVWFVAGGCASCAASIPAVAQHLGAFSAAGTRVVVLGLYGAFGQGPQGIAALASFGRAAAGPAFSDPAWTWGLASGRLTAAYDPGGLPDAYYLVDAKGHVTYQSSVPASTMGALLAHLDTGGARTATQTVPLDTATTPAALP